MKNLKKLTIIFISLLLIVNFNLSFAKATDTIQISIKPQFGQTEARSMLTMINEFRTGNDAWVWNESDTEKIKYSNLSGLTYDYALEEKAMKRAAEIAVSYSHTRPNGTSCFTLTAQGSTSGENIAAGYRTAEAVFEGWQEANELYGGQGHRRNMLNSAFKSVGIGHVYYNGYHYWVQEFSNVVASSTPTTAIDIAREESIDVLSSEINNSTINSNLSKCEIEYNKSIDLPKLEIKMSTNDTWPGKMFLADIPYSWEVKNPSIVSISNGKLTGKTIGTTTIETTVLGEIYSIPVEVKPISIKNASIVLANSQFVYSGEQHKPVPTSVTVDGVKLTQNTDYSISYENNINAGTAYVIVTGKNNYTGSIKKSFEINKASYNVTASGYQGTYDGKSHSITLNGVKNGSTIKYSTDNKTWSTTKPTLTNAGTLTVNYQITNPNYNMITGSKTIKIDKASYNVTANGYQGLYDGNSHSITLNGVKSGSTIKYSTDNKTWSTTKPTLTNVGTLTVTYQITNPNYNTITGKQTITINKASYNVTSSGYYGSYDGKSHSITLSGVKSGSTIKYSTDDETWSTTKPTLTNVGMLTVYYQITNPNYETITGCEDIIIDKASYNVTAKDYSGTYDSKSHTITLSNVKSGSTIKYRINEEVDWTTKKPTRTSAGTTTVYYQITNPNYETITGNKVIKINQRNVSTLKYSKLGNKTYTGKQIKPAVTVKYGSKTLKNGKDYKLSYGKNVSTGKATVTVTGKGNFKGSKTITFYIVPKKVTLSSVKAGKKQATVKYKKVTGASGYQIAYSTSKTKGFKYVNVSSKNASAVIKKLTSKKTYYFKVRAYKTIGKTKKYGSYSSIKSVKVK